MPIERYPVGREYTKRQRARADMADPQAVHTFMIEVAAGGPYTVERRLAEAEKWATECLEREGLPLDLNGPPYGDPVWLRKNERWSVAWYAYEILITLRLLRKQMERGEIRHAVDFALTLGVLATEVTIIQQRTTREQGKGGRGPRERTEQRRTEWRRQAAEKWKGCQWPTSQMSGWIAKKYDVSFETVKPVIADLNPKRKKSVGE